MSLCCHMTGEVIIQLPRYCLYTDIWLEKSSSSYWQHRHNPGSWMMTSPVICQYKHDLGSWMMTSPVIWQYKDSIWVDMTGEVIIQLPDHVSMLSYDWRSYHPATQILSLYWHMTGEVIIQLPDHVSILSYDWRSYHPATQILSLSWHMTGEVIIQLPHILSLYCMMTSPVICQYRNDLGSWMMTSAVTWQYRDSTWVAGCWLLLSYDSIKTVSG
jgi:hypothetical protein